jgi:hypothetical protein
MDLASTRGFSLEARPAIQPANKKKTRREKTMNDSSEAKNILKKLFMIRNLRGKNKDNLLRNGIYVTVQKQFFAYV